MDPLAIPLFIWTFTCLGQLLPSIAFLEVHPSTVQCLLSAPHLLFPVITDIDDLEYTEPEMDSISSLSFVSKESFDPNAFLDELLCCCAG